MRANKEKNLSNHGPASDKKEKEARGAHGKLWSRHPDLIYVYIGSCYATDLTGKQSELLEKEISIVSMTPVTLIILSEPQSLYLLS